MHYRYGKSATKMEYGRLNSACQAKKSNPHFMVFGLNDNREVYV